MMKNQNNISNFDGILLLNKPKYKTSSQLILDVKRQFNFKKVGHAGTLDPLATGLIVMLINKATKLSNYLLTANKKYNVSMKLFVGTDSGDVLGKITKIKNFTVFPEEKVIDVLQSFSKISYQQYPPIFSAIKYKGRKLYEYARKNIEVELKPREVFINKIEFIYYDSETGIINFNVDCSKGTYVRSLVIDIAKKFDTVATVYELKRIKSGNFNLADASNFDDLKLTNIISMYDALIVNNYPMLCYHNELAIKNGRIINLLNHNEQLIFIINKEKQLLAIYKNIGDFQYKCIRGI